MGQACHTLIAQGSFSNKEPQSHSAWVRNPIPVEVQDLKDHGRQPRSTVQRKRITSRLVEQSIMPGMPTKDSPFLRIAPMLAAASLSARTWTIPSTCSRHHANAHKRKIIYIYICVCDCFFYGPYVKRPMTDVK